MVGTEEKGAYWKNKHDKKVDGTQRGVRGGEIGKRLPDRTKNANIYKTQESYLTAIPCRMECSIW